MELDLDVRRGDTLFQANFVEPAFNLFKETSILDDAYRRFAPLGLTLSDIRYQAGEPSAAELSLECGLPRVPATIKLLLDRIEIGCPATERVQGGTIARLSDIILSVMGLVSELSPAAAYATYTFGISLHGFPSGQKPSAVIDQFAGRAPQLSAPLMGGGAVFYYGPEGARTSASLTVDVSAVVPDALFARVFGVWDGRQLRPATVPGVISTFVLQAYRAMGLVLITGDE